MPIIGIEHFPDAIHLEKKDYYFLHFEPLKKLQKYKNIFLTDKNDEDLFFEEVKNLTSSTQQDKEEDDDFFKKLADAGFYVILSMDAIGGKQSDLCKFNMERNLKIKKDSSNYDIHTFFFPPIYEKMDTNIVKNIRVFCNGTSFEKGFSFGNLTSDLFILKLDKEKDYSGDLLGYDPFCELHWFPYCARICLKLNKENPSRVFMSTNRIGKELCISINTTLIKKELCHLLDYIDSNPLDYTYYKEKQHELRRIYGWPDSF